MGKMKQRHIELIEDWESNVFTLDQLAEKYDLEVARVIQIIDAYHGFDD